MERHYETQSGFPRSATPPPGALPAMRERVLAAAEAAGRAPGELIWTRRSSKLAVIMLTGVMTVVFDTTIANVAISAATEMPARR